MASRFPPVIWPIGSIAIPAVVLGGLGTLVVVAIYSVFFPELRAVDRLDDA